MQKHVLAGREVIEWSVDINNIRRSFLPPNAPRAVENV
jgi:hypothetical protein